MKKRGMMFIYGMFLLSLAVAMTGCGKGDGSSGSGTNVTISGTVLYSPDSGSDVMLEGVAVEARNPSGDSALANTTTDADGAFSVSVPANRDFYLHATGKTVGSNIYVSENLQIENEAADRTGIKFYVVTSTDVNEVAGTILGADADTDAIFAMDVEDSSGNGIAGVTVSASPSVTKILYNNGDDGFLETPSTTVNNGSSVLGYVSNPGINGTYTFTMTGSTSGMTIDNPVKLRLIPGEISQPIEP